MVDRFEEVKVGLDIEATVDHVDFLKNGLTFFVLIKVFLQKAELTILRNRQNRIILKNHFTGLWILLIIVEEVGKLGVGGLKIDNITE